MTAEPWAGRYEEDEDKTPMKSKDATHLVACEAVVIEGDSATTFVYHILCKNPDDDIVHTSGPTLQTKTVGVRSLTPEEARLLEKLGVTTNYVMAPPKLLAKVAGSDKARARKGKPKK